MDDLEIFLADKGMKPTEELLESTFLNYLENNIDTSNKIDDDASLKIITRMINKYQHEEITIKDLLNSKYLIGAENSTYNKVRIIPRSNEETMEYIYDNQIKSMTIKGDTCLDDKQVELLEAYIAFLYMTERIGYKKNAYIQVNEDRDKQRITKFLSENTKDKYGFNYANFLRYIKTWLDNKFDTNLSQMPQYDYLFYINKALLLEMDK